jgi:hypothetical protein
MPNTVSNHTATSSSSDVDLIAEFLRKHPNIFEQHPELLDHVQLKDTRGTSSLLERQVARLQDRLEHIHAQHHELSDIATTNQQIMSKLDVVLARLLGITHLSEFLVDFPRTVREAFALEEAVIRTESSVSGKPSEKLSYKEASRRLAAKRAVCDDRWPQTITSLFFKTPVKSSALVPLLNDQDGELLGILALGSNDPKRFSPDLGSAHLDRIGFLAGACLARLLLEDG